MKKLMYVLIAMLLMLSAASAEDWCSIADMCSQAPARWTQTYETKWRTITIDAEIRVPEVDKVPVLLIESGADAALLTADQTGWNDLDAYHGFSLRWDNPWPDYPSKQDGKRLDSGQYGGITWYSGITADACYIPLSETALGDILALADETLLRSGIDPGEYTHHAPYHMWTQRMFYYGKKKVSHR